MELSVKLQMKKAWWVSPALWIFVLCASYRLLPVNLIKKCLEGVLPYSYKYRINNGKWKRVMNHGDVQILFEKTFEKSKKDVDKRAL